MSMINSWSGLEPAPEIGQPENPSGAPFVQILVPEVTTPGYSISEDGWKTIDIALPVMPSYSWPPTPAELAYTKPVNPGLVMPVLPVENYNAVSAIAPNPLIVTVPQPPVNAPLTELLLVAPTLNYTVPSTTVDWMWEVYTSAIITYLENKLDNYSLQPDAQIRARRITEKLTNVVTQLGCIAYDLDLTLQSQLLTNRYNRLITLGLFDIERKFDTIYLEMRAAVEQQKRSEYSDQQDIILHYVKAVNDNLVDNNKALVIGYKAYLKQLQMAALAFDAQIAYNEVRLEQYKNLIATERAKGKVNEIFIKNYRIEHAVQESLVRLYAIQMDTKRKVTSALLIEIEKDKADIEAFISEVQAELSVAERTEIVALAEVDKVKTTVTPYLTAAFNDELAAARLSIDAAKLKYIAVVSEFNARWQSLLSQRELFKEQSAAAEAELNLDAELTYNRNITASNLTLESRQTSKNSAFTQATENSAQVMRVDLKADTEISIATYDTELDTTRRRTAYYQDQAEIDVAEAMAKAKLTATLLQSISAG